MRIDKHSLLALSIGAFLTLGTAACGSSQRAGNRDQTGNQSAATDTSRDKIRTDNPNDVGGAASSTQSGQSGTAGATGTTGTSSSTSDNSSSTTDRNKKDRKHRKHSGAGSTSGTAGSASGTTGTTGGTTNGR